MAARYHQINVIRDDYDVQVFFVEAGYLNSRTRPHGLPGFYYDGDNIDAQRVLEILHEDNGFVRDTIPNEPIIIDTISFIRVKPNECICRHRF